MTNLKITAILTIAAASLFASPAMAEGEKNLSEPKVVKAENTQVLSSVETADMNPVRDEDGNIYYNHYVPRSDLFDASIDYEVVDTYEVTYNGRTYTNKIVTE